eukprot:3697868-Alexandrium_andersonii.AAC.1
MSASLVGSEMCIRDRRCGEGRRGSAPADAASADLWAAGGPRPPCIGDRGCSRRRCIGIVRGCARSD